MGYLNDKQPDLPLRVAIITKYWKNSSGGGIKTYLINMVDHLEKQNIDVRVLFNQGFDTSQIKLSGSRFLFPIMAFCALRRIRPNVIHSQSDWHCLLPGVMYKLIYGCNLIHTFRTEFDTKLPLIYSLFVSALVGRCNHVTFVSQGLQYNVQESCGLQFKDPMITYPGVASMDASAEELADFRFKQKIKENDIILLIQGFTSNKLKSEGAKIVIQSLVHLVRKNPNMVLIITGGGIYLPELKEYANHCTMNSNVIFTGDLANPFVPLHLCDIFLFPWLGKSGVGNALLEAMSVGKPIIATSVNGQGVAEVITDNKNGILVEPDPESIARTIELLLSNKDLCAMLGENAKKDAHDMYSWEKCAETFLELYS